MSNDNTGAIAGRTWDEQHKHAPAVRDQIHCSDFPALPDGMTREEAIDGLREVVGIAEERMREQDAGFKRWPTVDELFAYLETHGFPPPEPDNQNSFILPPENKA